MGGRLLVYLTPPLFFAIALLFSMLGMGGAQLYIPILFWMGMDFKSQAVPLGLLLNVVNSTSAMLIYARRRLIDWRVAVPLAVTMVLFAPLGTWLNIKLPARFLLACFALFTAAAAVFVLSGWQPQRGMGSPRSRWLLGAVGGSGLGTMAGLVGRGGGTFVVPLLYMAGVEAKSAAATSSFVVTCSALSAFFSHLSTAARPNWGVWGATALSVFLGSQIGARIMADRMRPRSVRQVFGWLLLAVAFLILLKDVL